MLYALYFEALNNYHHKRQKDKKTKTKTKNNTTHKKKERKPKIKIKLKTYKAQSIQRELVGRKFKVALPPSDSSEPPPSDFDSTKQRGGTICWVSRGEEAPNSTSTRQTLDFPTMLSALKP